MAKEQETGSTGISAEQLQTMLEAVVKAAKEPDAETKAERDAQKARRQQRAKQNAQAAAEEEAARKAEQARCGHRKNLDGLDKGHTIQGQVHNDGLFHALCLRCGKEWQPFIAPPELANGTIGLNDLKWVTGEIIEKWAEESKGKIAAAAKVGIAIGSL